MSIQNFVSQIQSYTVSIQNFVSQIQSFAVSIQNFVSLIQSFAVSIQNFASLVQSFTVSIQNFASLIQGFAVSIQNFASLVQSFYCYKLSDKKPNSKIFLARCSKFCRIVLSAVCDCLTSFVVSLFRVEIKSTKYER